MKFKIKETGVELELRGPYFFAQNGGFYSDNALKDLGLTLEEIKPEKKKLYAYIQSNGNVTFSAIQSLGGLKEARAPEFDIVYEDEK